jgi:hypothetical protein
MNDMKYVSYDGTFIWKITNCKEKMSKMNAELFSGVSGNCQRI